MQHAPVWLAVALLGLHGGATGAGAQVPGVGAQPGPGPQYLSVLFDADLGMRSGLETVITLNHGFSWAVDRSVGVQWFDEDDAVGKAGGVAARSARYVLVDLPSSYFTAVFAHEYVGHGARYRELGVGEVDYGFDAPPPYGPGGGFASTNLPPGAYTEHETMAIWSAGLEVQGLLQRRLGLRWISRDEVGFADALLFVWSFQIGMDYVQGSEDFAADRPDNDPRAYVRLLNATAGYSDPATFPWTLNDLKRLQRLNVVNPFLLVAVYSQVRRLWDGTTTGSLPAIPLFGATYLPALRTGLTPFGVEVHLENYLRFGRRAVLLDLARGDEAFHSSWGSAGLTVRSAVAWSRAALDVEARYWKQPRLQDVASGPVGSARVHGVAASVRGYLALSGSRDVTPSLIAEIGYKSRGFVEGYAMDAGPIAILGVGTSW